MKLMYIFMTTVLFLFSGKCIFAQSLELEVNTTKQVKKALWNEGVNLELSKLKKGPETASTKTYPEELTRAVELEHKKLYKTY